MHVGAGPPMWPVRWGSRRHWRSRPPRATPSGHAWRRSATGWLPMMSVRSGGSFAPAAAVELRPGDCRGVRACRGPQRQLEKFDVSWHIRSNLFRQFRWANHVQTELGSRELAQKRQHVLLRSVAGGALREQKYAHFSICFHSTSTDRRRTWILIPALLKLRAIIGISKLRYFWKTPREPRLDNPIMPASSLEIGDNSKPLFS